MVQSERAYQKQPTIFQNRKRPAGSSKRVTLKRYMRNVGLGFRTPAEVKPSRPCFSTISAFPRFVQSTRVQRPAMCRLFETVFARP